MGMMELLHILQEYQDTSRIMWNFYFTDSGLMAYSFGPPHSEIHEATLNRLEECRGKRLVGGYILSGDRNIGIRATSAEFTQEQRTLIARGVKSLIEKLEIEKRGLTIAYTEDNKPYFSEEFFSEFLS